MNIAFRYGQEYRNITQNQIFSEFTGRKLPFAKYLSSPFVVSTHIKPNLYVQRKQKKAPMWEVFLFLGGKSFPTKFLIKDKID